MASLAPLYEHCALRSKEPVESHRLIAEGLCDYRIGWHAHAAVETVVHQLNAPRLLLYAMRYGDEVDLAPRVYEDFLLVHYARRGPIELWTDGQRTALRQGEVAVSNPRRSIALRWSAHCEQVILRLPAAMFGADAQTIAVPPWHRLSRVQTQAWLPLMEAFAGMAHFAQTPNAGGATTVWLEHLETSMAGFLRQQVGQFQTHAHTGAEDGRPGSTAPRRRRTELLHAIAHEHLRHPLTLPEMARKLALSPRQLNEWTQQEWGQSPMAWLRDRRLDAIHRHFIEHPRDEVTTVAMEYGFGHIGRFARFYFERFGEYPSQTRRR